MIVINGGQMALIWLADPLKINHCLAKNEIHPKLRFSQQVSLGNNLLTACIWCWQNCWHRCDTALKRSDLHRGQIGVSGVSAEKTEARSTGGYFLSLPTPCYTVKAIQQTCIVNLSLNVFHYPLVQRRSSLCWKQPNCHLPSTSFQFASAPFVKIKMSQKLEALQVF